MPGAGSLPPVVDADWVRERLGEPDLVLGDCRGPNAHQRGHLPGSIPLVLGSPPPLADPARVRAVARTASSPDELPPAPELLQQLAELMGLAG